MSKRERIKLLRSQAVRLKSRAVLDGGSILDGIYTALNQIAALLVLSLLAPLLIYIAYRIWREDGAPMTYAQFRVGRRGELFRCFKFRSMVRNADEVLAEVLRSDPVARAEWERDHKLRNDPRITSIGHLLRKTSLDELPQLFNILRGEMHFVGPRPITVVELRRYGSKKRHYLSVRPGLTGLWQVSGRNNTTYEQRVELDAHYVERRNPLVDGWIAMRTIKVLVTREGAH